MASNTAAITNITSWWFGRVLGTDLIRCSSVSAEDGNDLKKDLDVTPIETAILTSASNEKGSNETCQVIGLYFTPVNSCIEEGNTEEFTSKLVDLYKRVNYHCDSMCSEECCDNAAVQKSNARDAVSRVKARKLEVIHVVLPPGASLMLEQSGDLFDELGFRKFVKNLPWFAIPYRDIHRLVRLGRRYRAQFGAPTLVLLEGATGRLITSNGFERLNEDPTGAQFPWTPRDLREVLRESGPYLPGGKRKAADSEVRFSELEGLVKGIYFSAHWCPPCKAFTPQLIETYSKVKARGHKFEVIFVSSDRSEESFTLYLSTMPWLAIPWEQEARRRELAGLLGVQGIPTLVLLDADGNVITADGRGEVNEDPHGENFPWRPKLVNILTERYAAKLHDYPAIILFVEGEDGEMEFAESVLLPAAEQFAMVTDSNHREEDRLLHFFVGCDCETSDLLREFIGLDDAVPLLTVVDIPGGQLCVMEDGAEITEQSVISFVTRFLDGTLPTTDISSNNIQMGDGAVMYSRKREFIITDENITQILEACNSDDDEDNLLLDEEDKIFLEEDIENKNEHVVIEDPEKSIRRPPSKRRHTEEVTSEPNAEKPGLPELPEFKWTRTYQPRQFSDNVDHEFGKVLLFSISKSCEMPKPFDIFSSTMGLKALLNDILIPESVRYAEQNGNVFSTNEDEMKAFLGMNLVMGYHTLPTIRSYWSTEPDLGVPYIAQIMPLHRFEDIRKYLHFSNNADQSIKQDRAYKVRPVIDHLNKSFQESLSATRVQSVDEHMIRFKGHNIMQQYIKNKPIKWGFKMWCRCDSETGYLFQFDLYTGRKNSGPEVGLGESVVLQLTKSISGLGCEIYIDNFFNSPALQYYLGLENIRSCGTVRINRKNMPKSFPPDKQMKRGDTYSLSSNGLTTLKWMDNKPVYLLTNFISPIPCAPVKRRQSGSSEKISIQCPLMIRKYNKWMGGVDLMDQKKVTYEIDRKAKIKYYLRIFFDLLDIGVNNAYVIYSKLAKETGLKSTLSSLEFKQDIARSLISNYSSRQRNLSTAVKTSRRLQMCCNPKSPEHQMIKSDLRKRCVHCASKHVENRTYNICEMCGVNLCFTSSRNCFAEFHLK